jgi:hypothetical protein
LTVEIASVDVVSGFPMIPEDVLATTKVPASEVTPSGDFQKEKITFDAPASVVASKKYALIFKYEEVAAPLENMYLVAAAPYPSDTYAGGVEVYRQKPFDANATFGPWTTQDQPFDLIFGIYVTSPDTAPKVEVVNPEDPAQGTQSAARSTNVTATFSERMDPNTLSTSTFKLFKVNKNGATSRITDAPVRLSADGLTARLNPFGSSDTLLNKSTKYKAVVTTGVKDLAGNSLDQDPTTTGNQNKVWYFTTGAS